MIFFPLAPVQGMTGLVAEYISLWYVLVTVNQRKHHHGFG